MSYYFELPAYVDDISDRCVDLDFLVHSFELENTSDLYNPVNFLRNIHIDACVYTLILDTNMYQFLINSYKKETFSSKHRDAISLLVFCQLSDIQVDPTYPVYEKLNRDFSNLDEVLNDLDIFYRINSADPNQLAPFALGQSDKYELHPPIEHCMENISKGLLKHQRIRPWHHYYLIILVISDIHLNQNNKPVDKLRAFLNWMFKDYLKSAIGVVYASTFWGEFPISKMMKLKNSQPKKERQKAIDNMTWDLMIMDKFLSSWIGNETQNEYIIATDDRVFKSLLKATIELQRSGGLEVLKSLIGEGAYNVLSEFDSWNVESESRALNSEKWGAEYIESSIRKYEIKLFFDE